MDVGEVIRALAWSIFEDGFQFEGFDPVTFTSSDPTVAVPDVIPQPTPLPGGPSYRTVELPRYRAAQVAPAASVSRRATTFRRRLPISAARCS